MSQSIQPVAPTTIGAYTPLEPTPTVAPSHEPVPWSLARRIAFRFVCAWLVLVFGLDVLAALPLISIVPQWLGEAYAPLLEWVGAHVLHTAAPAVDHPNGAGDKTVFWTYQFCVLGLALGTTIVWSLVDRRRTHYRTAHDRLRVYVRYTLAVTMLGYGFAKLLPSQFPDLGLARYIEPYGEFSPMGVLWSFMSTSHAYGFFTGMAETTGALLLFWRRTTTLGALVTVGALANVVALNMTYDVTVKGYSIQLLLAALFLAAADVPRLWAVLVRHAAVPAAPLGTTTLGPLPPVARLVLKSLLVATLVGYGFYGVWSYWHASYAPGTEPALFGIYEVERYVRNGAERAPLVTDSVRWRRVVIDRGQRLTVQMMSDSLRRFRVQIDTTTHAVSFTKASDSTFKAALTYARVDANHLRLAGRVAGDSIELGLRRLDHTRFPLVSRGFHWIQDDNYNR